MQNIITILPGAALCAVIAAAALAVEQILPVHFIGASVLALFIGMLLNLILKSQQHFSRGTAFCRKRLLKFSIILLGASLQIGTILQVGKISLLVMVFTLLTCFGLGPVIGKCFGLNWRLSNLINAGTGICGGSAIAALAPVIEAEEEEISYALSVTFIFDMLMILLFPLMGAQLGLSDIAYGLWTGTAVNDTSSVVAAGYAFSNNAGDYAAMVKLTRTLAIIPAVLGFSIVQQLILQKNAGFSKKTETKKAAVKSVFPFFILFFLCAALIHSLGLIPQSAAVHLKSISSFLMVTALAAIGLNTDVRKMVNAGYSPMLHGFTISALVVIVALSVEIFMGIV